MSAARGWLVALYVGIAALQAWDADVLKAPASIQAMVVVAIALPVAAYLKSRASWAHFGAVAISGIIVLVARFTSPVHHGELFMVPWLAFMFLSLERIAAHARQSKATRG